VSDGIAGKNGRWEARWEGEGGERTFDVGFTSGLHVCVRRQFKGSFTLGVLKKDVNLALLNQDGCTAEVVVGVFKSDLEPMTAGQWRKKKKKKNGGEKNGERMQQRPKIF